MSAIPVGGSDDCSVSDVDGNLMGASAPDAANNILQQAWVDASKYVQVIQKLTFYIINMQVSAC